MWRDSVKRNALRLLAVYSPTLIDVKEKTWCCFMGKGRLYLSLDVAVPIIVTQKVSQKNNYFLMTEFETLLLIFAKGGTVILEPTVFVNSQQSTIV